MKFLLSPHAKKRKRERKIDKAEIQKTLLKPDNLAYADRGRVVVSKKFNQRILEVIYVVENKKIVIVTLYYL